jgi:hypothetical protein
MSLPLQSVAPGHDFEFGADCVLDRNHRAHLKNKLWQHRAELVYRQRIVAVQEQMPAPIAHPHDKKKYLEISRRLPLAKHLEDSLLRIFVLRGRTLRSFRSS